MKLNFAIFIVFVYYSGATPVDTFNDVKVLEELSEDEVRTDGCRLEEDKRKLITNYQQKLLESYAAAEPIVGGDDAPPNKYKFMAALFLNRQQKEQFLCGGTLIDPCHILTAAHCFNWILEDDLSELYVYLGSHNLEIFEENRIVHKVKRVTIHKEFTWANDIAIMTLSNCSGTVTQYIEPIFLQDDREYTLRLNIAGWGQQSLGGSNANKLKVAEVTAWTNEDCIDSYGEDAPTPIVDSMICASEEGKDACQGDSGGPLFYCSKWISSTCVQVGITSLGKSCGDKKYPGIYTRISKMLPWIEKVQKCF